MVDVTLVLTDCINSKEHDVEQVNADSVAPVSDRYETEKVLAITRKQNEIDLVIGDLIAKDSLYLTFVRDLRVMVVDSISVFFLEPL